MSLIDAMRAGAQGTADKRATDDRGASFVEYALLIALIVMVCFGAMTSIGKQTSARYDDTAAKVAAAN